MTDREAIDVLFNEWKCIDRNDGIHCDRKCETCDLVMDVGIIREAYNMAISALQAQDSPKPTAGSVQNVQNEDLILRKAAIDAAESAFVRGVFPTAYIRELPSAQPEIIMCKDCRYVGTDATCCLVCNREGMGLKPFHVYPDDYCSYAERKDDE